jgi:hypothetical protein
LRCGAPVNKTRSASNEANQPKPSSSNESPDSASHSKQASPNHNSQEPPRIPNTSASKSEIAGTPDDGMPKMILGGFLIFILLVVLADWSTNGSSSTGAPSKPFPEPANEVLADHSSHSSRARLAESTPPIGTDHVLTNDQIRYCLLEKIRIEATQTEISHDSEQEISYSNSLVDDYNKRCGSYRYYGRSLSAVERSIQGHEANYRQDGITRIQSLRNALLKGTQTPSSSKPMNPNRKTDPLVRSTQQILSTLGYDTGPIDGVLGKKTTAAVMQFQKDYRFQVDGVIDKDFYSKLYDLRVRDSGFQNQTTPESTTESRPLPPKSSPQLPLSTENSVESKCAHFKPNDMSNYRDCIGNAMEMSTAADNRLPANAKIDYLGTGWDCQRGYYQQGNECLKVAVPANAKIDYLGTGWDCQRGYYQQGNECLKVAVPANAKIDYLGTGWDCQRGFFQQGNECLKVAVPANAKLDYLGTGWDCQRGFYQQGNECLKVAMPANAKIDYLGTGWDCQRGFFQQGNECLKVAVPANAKLDYLGTGWTCNEGFVRSGNTCV